MESPLAAHDFTGKNTLNIKFVLIYFIGLLSVFICKKNVDDGLGSTGMEMVMGSLS
jgi:hypothetical protein